jgi:hypothetical protein
MSMWSAELARYLSVRRSLGFELRTDERILKRFIEHAALAGFADSKCGRAPVKMQLDRPFPMRSSKLDD